MNKNNRLSIAFLILAMFFALSLEATADDNSGRNPKWAQPVKLKNSDNFFKVNNDLYRSAQPTAEALKEYEEYGIKTIINMRTSQSDAPLMTRGSQMNLFEIPVTTWDIEEEEVIAVLRLMKNSPKPVLVHCKHGADRTGLMNAMYRIVFEGWTKAEAIDEMKNGGYGFHSMWRNIPKFIENADVERIRTAVEQNN